MSHTEPKREGSAVVVMVLLAASAALLLIIAAAVAGNEPLFAPAVQLGVRAALQFIGGIVAIVSLLYLVLVYAILRSGRPEEIPPWVAIFLAGFLAAVPDWAAALALGILGVAMIWRELVLRDHRRRDDAGPPSPPSPPPTPRG